jgi:hypothetical protein
MPAAGTARTEPSHLRRRPCAVVHTPRPNRARGRRRARPVGAARRARPQGAADQPGQQGPAAAALRADRLGHPGRRGEPARAALCSIAAVDGRSDDAITLPAAGGGEVAVHPFRLQAPFSQLLEVRQHQIVHDADGLHVALLLRGSAPAGLSARVQAAPGRRTPRRRRAPVAHRGHPGPGDRPRRRPRRHGQAGQGHPAARLTPAAGMPEPRPPESGPPGGGGYLGEREDARPCPQPRPADRPPPRRTEPRPDGPSPTGRPAVRADRTTPRVDPAHRADRTPSGFALPTATKLQQESSLGRADGTPLQHLVIRSTGVPAR